MRQVIKHRDIRLLNMIRRTDPVIPYDIMRYFVAVGRADAAAKFYVDKFNLPAQDALQYLLAI